MARESVLQRRFSGPKVTMEGVLRMEVVFSTMLKGEPGLTRVILKKVEPKSNPITFACVQAASTPSIRQRIEVLIYF